MNGTQSEKILKALANHMGLTQTVDCYAVGSNEGGRYVSLFYSKLKFRVGTVYQERFKDLPGFIDTEDEAGEISTDRTRLEKQNLIKTCPKFGITRYQVGQDDDDKKAWRFGDVLWVSKAQAQPQHRQAGPEKAQPEQKYSLSKPPILETKDDGLDWAVGVGAYRDRDQAYADMKRLYNAKGKPDPAGLLTMWLGHVTKRVHEQVALATAAHIGNGNGAQPKPQADTFETVSAIVRDSIDADNPFEDEADSPEEAGDDITSRERDALDAWTGMQPPAIQQWTVENELSTNGNSAQAAWMQACKANGGYNKNNAEAVKLAFLRERLATGDKAAT